MTEVQIRFGAVFGHVDFPVLVGVHRARINVDIRVQFLDCDFKPFGFEDFADRGRGNPLSQ